MRKAEPWYWSARKGWYVQINGKQNLLAKDENPKKGKGGTLVPSEEAKRAYHRLMAVAGHASPHERAEALVPEVAEVFLGLRSGVTPGKLKLYARFLRVMCQPYMTRRFSALRPEDVRQVVEAQDTWGPNTKRDFVSLISSLFSWAKEAGYTATNAMAGFGNEYPSVSRTRVLTDEEFRALMDVARDLEFKQILQFIRGTGCRPGEARKLTAAHLHPEKPIVTLSWKEHKTGKKTKKPRDLYLPRDVEIMVRSLAARYPDGLLFRNSRNGRGWGEWSLSKRFQRYRRKLGWGEDVVPYTVRHTSLTRMLDDGMTLQQTAKVAGHTTVAMLMRTYYHPDEDLILEGVDKAHRSRKSKPK